MNRNACWAAASGILILACLLASAVPLLHFNSAVTVNYNEGWNVYRSQMVADGIPLYAAPPGLWTTNYPPLSFHIVSAVARFVHPPVLAGRLVAFAAFVVCCLAAAGIVRAMGGSRHAAAFAGLCFYAWLATLTPDRVVIDDPQLLGLAFTALGVLAFAKEPTPAWLATSAIGFTLGVFTKNNLIALPIAAGLMLVWQRRWRDLALWAGIGIVAAVLLLGLTILIDGPYFFAHLLRPRTTVLRQGLNKTLPFAVLFAPPFVLAALWLPQRFREPAARFLALAIVLSLAFAVFFSLGVGVDRNVFFDALLLLAVAVALGLAHIDALLPDHRPPVNAIFAILLSLPLLPIVTTVPARAWAALALLHDQPGREGDRANAVAVIAGQDGPAICETLLICVQAGKPLAYDTFFVADEVGAGRMPVEPELQRIRAGYYGSIQIDASVTTAALVPPNVRFPRPLLDAIDARYRPALVTSRLTVFVRR